MQENINEQMSAEENQEEVIMSFSEKLIDAMLNGNTSKLYKPVSNVKIDDVCIKEAFKGFLKDVECGKEFRIIDIISSAESVVKKSIPDENAGNAVYAYSHKVIGKKRVDNWIVRNSVNGIHSLIAIHNGITIDARSFNSSIPIAETLRYAIVDPKREKRLVSLFKKYAIKTEKIGEVISSDRVIISCGNESTANFDKSQLRTDISEAITLGPEHFNAFLSGYNAVCAAVLCGSVSDNVVIRFGLGDDINAICARALGYYSAVTYFKSIPLSVVYTNDESATVAVPRPNVEDGDYLYLLRLRNDEYGLPEKGHYGQLYYYLNEKKKMGVIKDVLPLRENVENVISRLSGDSLEYVSISEIPKDSFGIIVSAKRGDTVNGIKIGYFKGI